MRARSHGARRSETGFQLAKPVCTVQFCPVVAQTLLPCFTHSTIQEKEQLTGFLFL